VGYFGGRPPLFLGNRPPVYVQRCLNIGVAKQFLLDGWLGVQRVKQGRVGVPEGVPADIPNPRFDGSGLDVIGKHRLGPAWVAGFIGENIAGMGEASGQRIIAKRQEL